MNEVDLQTIVENFFLGLLAVMGVAKTRGFLRSIVEDDQLWQAWLTGEADGKAAAESTSAADSRAPQLRSMN